MKPTLSGLGGMRFDRTSIVSPGAPLHASRCGGWPDTHAFKTILASATLTEDVLVGLRPCSVNLDRFFQVAAPVLATEPSYWQSTDLKPARENDDLLEALRHLPRPAIVYTTASCKRTDREPIPLRS